MVNLGDRPCCSTCGAYLRRTRTDATQCDPCRRIAPALSLDPALWDEPALSAALACLDFGPVFLRVRAETSCSQRRLGELFDLDQSTLSKIELGKRPLTDAATVIRVANELGIPAGKLGFRYGVTVGTTGQEGGGVDRRDAMEQVAALSVGAGLPLDRLIALFPSTEPTGTRHLGAADVEAIEQATAAFTHQDFAEGSGRVRDTAIAQLYATLPLRGAQVSDELRPRLMIATAWLAMQAGWMSFDVKHHDAARRLWLIGLGLARDSEHPLGSDLTVYLIYDMALQAVHLGFPDEALRLVHFGYGAAAGTNVSPATTSCLANIQARAHAARSDAAGCDRALGQAVDYFTAIDPTRCAPWVAFHDETSLSAYQGAAHYGLALASRDPRAAGRAVPLLQAGVEGFGPGYARPRALYLPDLAGAHALAGDIDTAVALGHQAIDAVTSVHSPRVYDRLQVLHTILEPLHASPGVAELRDRLSTTAT
ncbi:MAG: helix-turn-helix transcriptional regulator [Pseudonocardiales bacterium]|nr:helix-turn-helix transcriptional regulator [Pseudonocardiales bacterium]